MLTKNQIIEAEVIEITGEGNGVCRHEGEAVFVPYAAPGDRLRVRIVKAAKRYAYGRIEEILTPSPHRIAQSCPVYGKCGGCCFRHISYAAELSAKEQAVAQNLRRLGGIDAGVSPIIPSPLVDGYRNKGQFPCTAKGGAVAAGLYRRGSHDVVECSDCALQPPLYKEVIDAVIAFARQHNISAYDEANGRGILRHIYIRDANVTGEIMVCLVINTRSFPHADKLVAALAQFPAIKSIMLNVNTKDTNVILGDKFELLHGREYITDILCGNEITISPAAFYQVNRAATELLYAEVARAAAIEPSHIVADIYCGAGTIGLSVARHAKELIGIEINKDATADAVANASRNGITNARFINADATAAAKELAAAGTRIDVAIIDPPRSGCTPELIAAVRKMNARRVVMVSCHSATLARDLAAFADCGYSVTAVQPVDMFPRTGHVETVVCLESKMGGD